jgi:O-antigen biosynthesis protein
MREKLKKISNSRRSVQDVLEMVRKTGLKIWVDSIRTIDPNKAFYSYTQLDKYNSDQYLIKSLNYSSADLAKNWEVINEFKKMGKIEIKTVNWFIPFFDHAFGGIYTILRFADYFHAKRDIMNRLIIYGNTGASETEIKQKITKRFPNLSTEKVIILRSTDLDVLPEADISIATYWTSAYLLLKFNKTKGKFYFIQDYEPLFYPAGAFYALAEATYRFGFYGIVNTPGLCDFYVKNYEGNARYFVPSIDSNVFYPSEKNFLKPSQSNPFTIFFYARPSISRNASELGFSALQKIKKKYGECVRIYSAGSNWDPRSYDLEGIINLGILPYEKTGDLYRNCDLGLSFIFTKHPSYLPFELMACGCPVITNHNQATTWFLKDDINCLLTEPSVSCICENIERLIDNSDLRKKLSFNGLKSIQKTNWNEEIEKIYEFICQPNLGQNSKSD